MAQVPPAPSPPQEEQVTIYFTAKSARLSNIAKAKLDEVALKMKQDPDLTAKAVGYYDPSDRAESGARFAEQRAQSLKNYLVTRHGIDPSRISTEAGGAPPEGSSPEQNRKAVLTLTER